MDFFLIIFAVLHSYVFAIMFFSKRKLSSKILGFYMLNFFIQGFLFANFHIFQIQKINILFYLLISSLSLCDWPLMYLYIRIISEENFSLNKKILKHFIPALSLFTLQIISFLFLSSQEKLLLLLPKSQAFQYQNLFYFMSVINLSVLILFIQWIVYSILMIKKLILHRRNILKNYSYTEKINLNWLIAFVVLYLIYFALEIIIFLFPKLNITEPVYFSIVSVHIFIVGIWGLKQKDIYIKNQQSKISDPFVEEKEQNSEPKRQELLTKSQSVELAATIKKLMEEKELYLNPELSLDDLANDMQIHKNYISYVINEEFGVNFYNFVNQYRIEKAKLMLSDSKYDNFSIEGIAKSCGYKTRNVFYPVFKKFVGITPLDYKKKYKKN